MDLKDLYPLATEGKAPGKQGNKKKKRDNPLALPRDVHRIPRAQKASAALRYLTPAERKKFALPPRERNPRVVAAAVEALKQADALEKSKLNAKVGAFERKTTSQQQEIMKQMIDEVRQAQRAQYLQEVGKLSLACVEQDFGRLATLVSGKNLTTTCAGDEEILRRAEVRFAMENSSGKQWPVYTGSFSAPCAYDAVLLCAGLENFDAYYKKAGALRIAQRDLFDATGKVGDMCDITDTGLLCLPHATVRSSQLFSTYMLFDHLSQALIGSPVATGNFNSLDMTEMYKFVHTKHGPAHPMQQLEWATDETTGKFWGWGDFEDRIVTKEVVRFLEELLLGTDLPPTNARHFNWANQQRLFKDVAGLDEVDRTNYGTSPPSRGRILSGQSLVEKVGWDGELAAEVMSILWRNVHRDEHAVGAATVPGGVEQMPELPSMADFDKFNNKDIRSFNYFERDFPMPAAGAPQIEFARCYLRRLVYTSLACSWYLHSPISVCMFNSWHKAATADVFVSNHTTIRNSEGESIVEPDDWYGSTVYPIYRAHRRVGISIMDGETEAQSHNINSLVEQRLASVDANGVPRVTGLARKSGTYVRPTKMLPCGQAFNIEAYGIVTMRGLWRWKWTILAAGVGVFIWWKGLAIPILTKLGEWTTYAGSVVWDAAGAARDAGDAAPMDSIQDGFNATLGQGPAQLVAAGRGAWQITADGGVWLLAAPFRPAGAIWNWLNPAVPGGPPIPPGGPIPPSMPPIPSTAPAILVQNADLGTVGAVGESLSDYMAIAAEELARGSTALGAPLDIGAPPPEGSAEVDIVDIMKTMINVSEVLEVTRRASGAYNDPELEPGSNVLPVASYALESSGFAFLGQASLPKTSPTAPRAPSKRELRMLLDSRQSAKDRAGILRVLAPDVYRRGAFEFQSEQIITRAAAARVEAPGAGPSTPAPPTEAAPISSTIKSMHMLSVLDDMAPRPLVDPLRKRMSKKQAPVAAAWVEEKVKKEEEEVWTELLAGAEVPCLFEPVHSVARRM